MDTWRNVGGRLSDMESHMAVLGVSKTLVYKIRQGTESS